MSKDQPWQDVPIMDPDHLFHGAPQQGSERWVSLGVAPPPDAPEEDAADLLHSAWGVIANAGWEGSARSPGWQEAAERWRDRYHRWREAQRESSGG